MAYIFNKSLETGHENIDKQHKKLFEAINNLLDACSKGQGRNELEGTAKFLYEYTSIHFSDEEKLQKQVGYPDYINHKKYHEEFKNSILEIMKELQLQGPTIVLIGKVNSKIGDWLVNHIKKEDVKIAEHIKKNS